MLSYTAGRDFADVSNVKDLEMGDYLGLSRWSQVITKSLSVGKGDRREWGEI